MKDKGPDLYVQVCHRIRAAMGDLNDDNIALEVLVADLAQKVRSRADGGGGAAACEMCKKLQGQIDALHTVLDIRERRVARTHPARSGVVSDEDVRDAERLKEIVRRAEKVIGFRRVRFELRFDPLTDTDLSLIDYIDAAIQGERHA